MIEPLVVEFEVQARAAHAFRVWTDRCEWGQVIDWEPPERLRYRWHLFFPPEEATAVEVTFAPSADGTAVRIEQRGWDRLGDAGPPRRTRTGQAWAAITPLFATACGQAQEGASENT